MVQVYLVGSTPSGTAESSSDALNVSATLSQTPSFQRTMSNPAERDAFTRGVDARLEMALSKGDTAMYKVLSALKGQIKNYPMPATDLYSSDEGFRAIG